MIGRCRTPAQEKQKENHPFENLSAQPLEVPIRNFYLFIFFWIQSLKAMWDNTLCAIIYERNNQPESYILQHSVP